VVLYTEVLLNMLYSIYIKHQVRIGAALMQIEEFRLMFEEQQDAIGKLLNEDQLEVDAQEQAKGVTWH
jgi:hypothetical protein